MDNRNWTILIDGQTQTDANGTALLFFKDDAEYHVSQLIEQGISTATIKQDKRLKFQDSED